MLTAEPLHWFDPSQDVVIEPLQDAARFWRRRFGSERIAVAPTLIYASDGMGRLFTTVCAAMDGVATPLHDRRQDGYAHYRIAPGAEVTVYRAPQPAPYAAADLEWLLALGVTDVLFLNGCGSLTPTMPVGSLVVPDELRREEGTSFHYVPPETRLRCDAGAQERLLAAIAGLGASAYQGNHWTTDAIYRETVAKVRSYAAEGFLSVEMELSAVAAVARYHRRRLAALLLVTDVVTRPHTWPDAIGSALCEGARLAAAAAVSAALSALP